MPSRVVLLTGPAGAGKSTTADRLATTRANPTVLLDHDLVRTFVRSGYVRPDKEWGPAAEYQWRLARDLCASASAIYASQGFDVVIDAYAPGGWPDWIAPGGPAMDVVILLPTLDIVRARNAQRVGRALLDAEDLDRNYEGFAQASLPRAITIDNSALTVEQTVDAISEALAWL